MISLFDLIAQAGALLEALNMNGDPRVWWMMPGPGITPTDPTCPWAKARRRFLRRIAALPVPEPRPHWWTSDDEALRDPDLKTGGWACRTCCHWRSPDGRRGVCGMPETPSTVNNGETGALALCEQWTACSARHAATRRATAHADAALRQNAALAGWGAVGERPGAVLIEGKRS